jgi:predicted transcriptional regulator
MAIKTFEAFVSEKSSPKLNENPAVAMAAADMLSDAYDEMKEMMKKEAMAIDSDDTSMTANEAMCEMMKENAAMAAMAAKELTEMMSAGPADALSKDEAAEDEVNENPTVAAMAADKLMEMMKEAFDMKMEEMMKSEGMAKDIAKDVAADAIAKKMSEKKSSELNEKTIAFNDANVNTFYKAIDKYIDSLIKNELVEDMEALYDWTFDGAKEMQTKLEDALESMDESFTPKSKK